MSRDKCERVILRMFNDMTHQKHEVMEVKGDGSNFDPVESSRKYAPFGYSAVIDHEPCCQRCNVGAVGLAVR